MSVRLAAMVGGLVLAAALPARADEPPAPAQPAPAPPAPVPPPAGAPLQFPAEDRIQTGDGKVIHFYRANFVPPDQLAGFATTHLKFPASITLQHFARQNQVLIQGTPDEIEMVLDAFAYFDIPEPQVFVECKIVEVTYESNFEFGLSSELDRDKAGPNTFWRGETVTLNPPSFFQALQPGNLPFQGGSLAFGLVGKMAEKYGSFDLTLQALQREGNAEVLSKPSIVTTQAPPNYDSSAVPWASVKTSQRTPIIGITTATIAGNAETLNTQTTYVETKIELAVTPRFIGDGFVTLDLQPTVSGVTGFSVAQGIASAPIISNREAKTRVTMADGETLIIGGLYTNSTVVDKATLPLLCKIPVLGKLFERTKDQKVKTELVFFITPHILRKRTDFKVIIPPAEKERLGSDGAAPCDPPTGSRCPPR